MRKITIIGTGYVGLVSGAGIAEFGNDVTCVDIDKNKIQKLNSGEILIYEPELDSIVNRNKSKDRLKFSSDINKSIKSSDIIFIAVGTPQDKNGEADITAIQSVAKLIGENLNKYKIICTKSTVPIGTGKKIETIIKSIKTQLPVFKVKPTDFQFELLYGIRRDISFSLLKEGYNVTLYIPFGEEWLPYTLRRLKEFKNLRFVIFNILKELFSGNRQKKSTR